MAANKKDDRDKGKDDREDEKGEQRGTKGMIERKKQWQRGNTMAERKKKNDKEEGNGW